MVESQAKTGSDSSRDPFCISDKGEWTSQVMKNSMANGIYGGGGVETLKTLRAGFLERNRMIRDRRHKAFLLRFLMALFGGVALIGPMILMVLHHDRNTSLSTTSVAVFLFAIVVACFSDAGPEATTGAVAAYAAVLVVFVGTGQS
jgi:hypothetical protein